MVARWRDRVSQAELYEYGPGWIGTIYMLMAERRMPTRTVHSGQQLVRACKYALGPTAVFAASVMALLCVLLIAVLFAIF